MKGSELPTRVKKPVCVAWLIMEKVRYLGIGQDTVPFY
jgi:hypothetical protein